jgi:DNA polymerase Ligase (LigD)
MPRYVILLHEIPPQRARATHWDLMLEWDGVLRTWALPREPMTGLDCEAEQLPDHRTEYLDYEGPLSDDRGSVVRWDEGHYHLERESGNELTVLLKGRRLEGRMTLDREQIESHSWRVALSAAPTRG